MYFTDKFIFYSCKPNYILILVHKSKYYSWTDLVNFDLKKFEKVRLVRNIISKGQYY